MREITDEMLVKLIAALITLGRRLHKVDEVMGGDGDIGFSYGEIFHLALDLVGVPAECAGGDPNWEYDNEDEMADSMDRYGFCRDWFHDTISDAEDSDDEPDVAATILLSIWWESIKEWEAEQLAKISA
jgi:hypothetical protein